jgi:hypothetical protein
MPLEISTELLPAEASTISAPSTGSWTHTTVHIFAAEGRGDGSYPKAGLTEGDQAGTVFTIKP